MKDKDVRLIGIEEMKRHPELILYMDENIAVTKSISNLIEENEEAVKIDGFCIAFCEKGSMTIHINGNQHLLKKDHCALLPQGTIIRKAIIHQNSTLKIAVFFRDFLDMTLRFNKNTWNIMLYLFQNPIHAITSKSSYKMYLYKELLTTIIQEKPHTYSKQTRRYLMSGLFYELFAQLEHLVPEEEKTDTTPRRATYIVRDFLDLVNADNGSHRSVAYYADRLCYSAKYLSSVIKEVTGRGPLQIINEHAIKEIKYKLKHSNTSMKEMADYFDFPTPSFFGKFVKTHTGMSPLQYRASDNEE